MLFPLQEFVATLGSRTPLELIWFFFIHGGWIFMLLGFLYYGWWAYRFTSMIRWEKKNIKYKVFAVDVPKVNEQSFKAVEQIFHHLHGMMQDINLKEKYIDGEFQLAASFELVSIEGNIQFVFRTPEKMVDHLHSVIYAQYSDAEIVEIEDYAQAIPKEWPNDKYDLFGVELKFVNKDPYPIRTYPYFEHTISQKTIDPLAAILESLSALGEGEMFCLQLVCTPLPDGWQADSGKLVDKLIKRKKSGGGFFAGMWSELTGVPREVFAQSAGQTTGTDVSNPAGSKDPPSQMLFLSPGEQRAVEAIQMKASKVGYRVKMRYLYLGRKENFFKPHGIHSFMGSLRQFSAIDMNGFRWNKLAITKADYFFTKYRKKIRQKKLVRYYKSRSQSFGAGKGPLLNPEELASLWHFPLSEEVKTESIKRTAAKKLEAPTGLPVTQPALQPMEIQEPKVLAALTEDGPAGPAAETMQGPPTNLPVG